MENNSWSKTMLTVYRYLPRVCFVIDKLVKVRAKNSAYNNGSTYSFNNVFNLSNKILDLTERKINLINLKILTEKALKGIDRTLARILILKYIDGRKSDEIASLLGVCTRTYFRKCNNALTSFSKYLSRLGYSPNKLNEMLKNEKWINEAYREIEKENSVEEKESEMENKLEKNIMFEFKKVNCFSN